MKKIIQKKIFLRMKKKKIKYGTRSSIYLVQKVFRWLFLSWIFFFNNFFVFYWKNFFDIIEKFNKVSLFESFAVIRKATFVLKICDFLNKAFSPFCINFFLWEISSFRGNLLRAKRVLRNVFIYMEKENLNFFFFFLKKKFSNNFFFLIFFFKTFWNFLCYLLFLIFDPLKV